jgi:hypothetical protein
MRWETVVAAVVAAMVAPSPAQAAWSPPLRPAGSGHASEVSLAVNRAGQVGTAWVAENDGVTSVRAAVGTASHTLLRSRSRAVTGLTVVMSARGEASVAWMEQRQTDGTRAGPIILRAAFRTRTGRWSAAQRVTRTTTFFQAQPRLAQAPDGTVALTLNARIDAAPGVAVAWRSPGHRFGRLWPVAATGDDVLFEPTLTFDARGRGRLAGIVGCGGAASSGVLFTAAGPRRPFRGRHTIAPAPATHLRVASTGLGRAAATWIGAPCSTGEDLNGMVLGRTLRDGLLSDPVLLDGLGSRELVLTATSGGAAEATWTQYPPGLPQGSIVTSRIEQDGAASSPAAAADGWSAVASTPRGARVVERLLPSGFGAPQGVGAQAVDGGPVDVAPLPGPARYAVAAAPFGAALAAAAPGEDSLRVSAWRHDR